MGSGVMLGRAAAQPGDGVAWAQLSPGGCAGPWAVA